MRTGSLIPLCAGAPVCVFMCVLVGNNVDVTAEQCWALLG